MDVADLVHMDAQAVAQEHAQVVVRDHAINPAAAVARVVVEVIVIRLL